MALKTPLGRVRGLGSAKSGTHHWWMQRVTAIGMLFLMAWFVYAVVTHMGADYDATRAFVRQPVVAIVMLLLIGTAFYHMRLGVQVVIEDYLKGEGLKVAAIVALNFGTAVLSVACLFSVLRIAFGA